MINTYDYHEAVYEDVKAYVALHLDIDDNEFADADEFAEYLHDTLWAEDYVTGNGSGSYTFNRAEAEEYICHNLDLLGEAIEEFGCDMDVLKSGAEACDVTIRCYLLDEAISKVLEEADFDYPLSSDNFDNAVEAMKEADRVH